MSKKNRTLRGAVDNQVAVDSGVNEFGIPTDPEAAVKAVESGAIVITADPDSVTDGPVFETFSQKIKGDDDVVIYEAKNQPFAYKVTSNLPGVFAAYEDKNVKLGEAALSEDQIAFLGTAFPGDKQGAVIAYLIGLHRASERRKAQGVEYQRILALKKPLTEDDKSKAFDNAVRNTVRSSGLPEAVVRKMLAEAIANAKA